ncbi:MAG TPA: hypothetical protein VL201_03485 [Patescibacteria group bacterium]|jgi:hypothetical protein|nr:hypothetical protein [Patescibacteria group bacterium]
MHKKSGYILVLTMIMMAALSAIVVYIFNRGMTAIPLVGLVIEREKAKMVALSGVEVARSLIVAVHDTAEGSSKREETETSSLKPENTAKQPQNVDQKVVQQLLPMMGRWTTYLLKEHIDGTDGELKICITCEDGKINLNKIFDFKTHKFVGEGAQIGSWKIMLEALLKQVETATKTTGLFAALESFLKTQKGPLEEVTQLLLIPAFAPFADKLYVQAPEGLKEIVSSIALTDLFTLYSASTSFEPWFLSTSVQLACGIGINMSTVQQRTKDVMQWTKNFKPSAQWKTDWNVTLKNVYTKEFNALPKGLDNFFAGSFKPTFFGVFVQGTVGKVTQKIYAIIERTRHSHNNQIVYDSVVRKLYIV